VHVESWIEKTGIKECVYVGKVGLRACAYRPFAITSFFHSNRTVAIRHVGVPTSVRRVRGTVAT